MISGALLFHIPMEEEEVMRPLFIKSLSHKNEKAVITFTGLSFSSLS